MTRRRARRRAYSSAWVVALVLVWLVGAAEAKPRRREAKLNFDRGVAAYQKGNYEAASEALGKSFEIERDIDTLFAWAQAERKLERCDKAIGLYEKLLTFNMPAANKSAIEASLEECRVLVAQQKAKTEPAPVAAKPQPDEPLADEPRPQPVNDSGRVVEGTISDPGSPVVQPVIGPPLGPRPWYKDPVALGLTGGGLVISGVGTALLISANSLGKDSEAATSHDRALELRDKARSRGNISAITLGVGGAALVGGIVWIVLHRGSSEQRTVTGWVAPGEGGLAVTGAF